ncbi:addiction module protein [Candidatus Desantisbacteria bacterium]|nr:addiction module protein [Candidatus Desantisbacteria bacterium]
MSMKLEEITVEAMKLEIKSRAELAEKLILSLDTPSDSEIEHLWVCEAERRLKEFQEKKVSAIPADEVYRRAIGEIS